VILILSDEAVLDIEEAFIWYFEINPVLLINLKTPCLQN